MFIDYKKIVNLIIEELINNNAYSSKLLMSNLQKARLINVIIDNGNKIVPTIGTIKIFNIILKKFIS